MGNEKRLYQLAREVARIIHEKSWLGVGVEDVLLFGSAMRDDAKPKDLDMLILHNGRRLKEFNIDPYAKGRPRTESDMPIEDGNRRYYGFHIFMRLGYRGDPDFVPTWEAGSYKREIAREKELESDSALRNILRLLGPFGFSDESLNGDPLSLGEGVRRRISRLFDVHVLSTALLRERDEHYDDRRAEAMRCCRDPTFWHTVLTEGRLYATSKRDFTIPVDQKYRGATALFEQR